MGVPDEDKVQELVAQGVGQSQPENESSRRTPTWPFPTGNASNADSGTGTETSGDAVNTTPADGVQQQAVLTEKSASALGLTVVKAVPVIQLIEGEADQSCEGPASCFHHSHCEIEQRASLLTENQIEEAAKLLAEDLKVNPNEAHVKTSMEVLQEVVRHFAFAGNAIRRVSCQKACEVDLPGGAVKT